MDIYIQSEIGSCSEYMPKREDPVSIVISPVRMEGEEGHLRFVHGCNMWQGCENPNCWFSKAARKNPRVKSRQ